MPYFPISDDAYDHPKVLAAGNAAFGLWTRLGSWTSDHGTDGIIPAALARSKGTPGEIRRLLDVGLLELAVRRLMPVECERLQGWPDGHTDGQADSSRYRQAGNGVASPVAEWVGRQIMAVA